MAEFQTDALDRLKSAVPGTSTLFHYTSQNGLRGIINEKVLWLSSIRHLNDATEFGYAVELARDKLNRKLQLERGPWNSYYGAVLERLDGMKDMPVFVGSFSEQEDLLSQWRAYAADGIGFSIGFEYEHLRKISVQQRLSIMRCAYNQAEHDAILEDLINSAGTLVNGGEHVKAAAMFLMGLIKFAPALKDPSFFEEKEWRVVHDTVHAARPSTVKFRAGKSMLIPYTEFNLAAAGELMPVSKVVVGPTPHKELSIDSIKLLLFNSPNVEQDRWTVAPSQVPYRSW